MLQRVGSGYDGERPRLRRSRPCGFVGQVGAREANGALRDGSILQARAILTEYEQWAVGYECDCEREEEVSHESSLGHTSTSYAVARLKYFRVFRAGSILRYSSL